MKDVSQQTRQHLTRVYTALLAATGACGTGMYLNATVMLSGFIVMIGFMIVFAFAQMQIRNPQNSQTVQIGWMLGLAFALGLLVGPGINQIAQV